MNYLDIFKRLNAIPRPSHHEERVADYLCLFAEAHGLEWQRDDHDCVVIRKPASPGYEAHDPVVILNHMDMVCVAGQGVDFDPLRDGIQAYTETVDGRLWMKARGTSLGADNGIGLSMALAILADESLQHPPLEVLTTTNEEDGMTGAANLSPDFIRGRRVINLDSEAYDEITVGAAGALIQNAELPLSKIAMPRDYTACAVTVGGGRGGHSGVDIAKGRANAIKVLANLLLVAIRQCNIKLYLVSFNGGQAAASIPSSAEAKIVIPTADRAAFETLVGQCGDALRGRFSVSDPDVSVAASPSVWHGSVLSEESTHLLLASINAVPVGPTQMRTDRADIPLTSNNIGVVRQGKESFLVTFHTRSFSDAEMEHLAGEIRKIFQLSGATVTEVMKAPAWEEDMTADGDGGTNLVELTCQTFLDVLGFEPRRVSMHFVLEAGYFVRKFPGIHIASIGPRIIEPHSTGERLDVETADDIWRVTVELLKRL